ncbi:hypothetical protein C9426_32940 [Serratia sp. S1B]|nr:hypothetical protein C9426_32940 [Serratia sp. S1B]
MSCSIVKCKKKSGSLMTGMKTTSRLYPSPLKLQRCWLRYEVRPWTSPLSGPPQAAFKSSL